MQQRLILNNPELTDVTAQVQAFEEAFGDADIYYTGPIIDLETGTQERFGGALAVDAIHEDTISFVVTNSYWSWIAAPAAPYTFEIVPAGGQPSQPIYNLPDDQIWGEFALLGRELLLAFNADSRNATLACLGFQETYDVRSLARIDHLFKPRQRCGIYVLHFAGGTYYVGQSIDITQRYLQHRRIYHHIECLSFKRLKQDKLILDEHEQSIIKLLERKTFPLLNIIHTSISYQSSDFDILMPLEEQKRWLEDITFIDNQGERVKDPGDRHREKYRTRYREQFVKLPFATVVVEVFRAYAQVGIPRLLSGEASSWACSCLPSYSVPGVTIYGRINLNWQEVLNAHTTADTRDIRFSLYLARSPLETAYGLSLQHLLDTYPALVLSDFSYTPGGQDQINLLIDSAPLALELLRNPAIIRAIRLFNLNLIKKGPCAYTRYHCFDLADQLVA